MRIRAIAARRHPSLIRGLVEFLVPRGVCTQTPRGFELSDVTVGVARPEVVLTALGSDTRRFGADTLLSTATRCPLASVLAWTHTSRLVPRRRRGSYTRVATGCGAKPRHDVFAREASSRNRAGSQRPSSPRSAREEHGYENLRATGHVHRRDALVRRRRLALAGLPVFWALAPRDGLLALPRASPSRRLEA